MRRGVIAAVVFLLTACQGVQTSGTRVRSDVAGGDAAAILTKLVPGEYDNHEQVARAAAGTAAPIRVQHELRIVDHGADQIAWAWRVRTAGSPGLTATWLLRGQYAHNAQHLRLVPWRPLSQAAADAAFADPAQPFRFVAEQWAELAPCAFDLAWDGAKIAAAANVDACSALLPGLGEGAALLPLRFSIDGDMLRVATFADAPRGADAVEEARRVRWFEGWAVINGGGPQAKAGNQDWHLNRELRLSSEGGRVPLRWRDGASSGYSLELEHTTYPERKLSVLQLNVIDDASGKTVTYAWTDPQADALGLNLGWLQVGFSQSAGTGAR
jgi:hypothetical protein